MQHEMQHKTGRIELQYTRLAIMFQHKSKAFSLRRRHLSPHAGMERCTLKNTAIQSNILQYFLQRFSTSKTIILHHPSADPMRSVYGLERSVFVW